MRPRQCILPGHSEPLAEIPKWQPALVALQASVDPSPCPCRIPEFVIADFDCEIIKLVPRKPSADCVCCLLHCRRDVM